LLQRYHIENHGQSQIPLKPDGYNRFGYIENSNNTITSCSKMTEEDIKKEEMRKKKWKRMLDQWKKTKEKPRKLKKKSI